jgi:hypothetical protein
MPITRNTEETKRMKVGVLAILMTFLLAAGIPFAAMAGTAIDTDSDTVPDASDNCVLVPNAGALFCDTDQDGYGNVCDADTDNDGVVGSGDFSLFGLSWNTSGAPGFDVSDFDCDGVVGSGDFSIFGQSWTGAPGPSGLSCAGTITCP